MYHNLKGMIPCIAILRLYIVIFETEFNSWKNLHKHSNLF